MKSEKQVMTAVKHLFITSVFLLYFNGTAQSQSFSAGHAVPLWGNTSQAMQVDVSVGALTATYIHIYKSLPVDNTGLEANKNFLAIFLSPKIDEQVISFMPDFLTVIPMAGLMHQPFPNENGKKFHFGISLSAEVIDRLDLYYKHISNGYFGETNLGIDTVGLKVKL